MVSCFRINSKMSHSSWCRSAIRLLNDSSITLQASSLSSMIWASILGCPRRLEGSSATLPEKEIITNDGQLQRRTNTYTRGGGGICRDHSEPKLRVALFDDARGSEEWLRAMSLKDTLSRLSFK